MMNKELLHQIANGRTDLVFEYVAEGHLPNSTDEDGVSLSQHCAYYGDVSAIRFLLASGETLESLGLNLGLSGAAFHGHWQLCQFLIENGADVNYPDLPTAETPLHSALCTSNRVRHDLVLKVLLAAGANPNSVTKPAMETGCFMRDCRTKGETPLHRAAAFGNEETIQLLLNAGARIDVQDMNGDSPLSWGSWYGRPDSILRKLCYGNFSIRAGRQSMEAYVAGQPTVK